jgi:hypothetical protein
MLPKGLSANPAVFLFGWLAWGRPSPGGRKGENPPPLIPSFFLMFWKPVLDSDKIHALP